MANATITFNLNPTLQSFLMHEFKTTKDGAIILNNTSDIGRYINSMFSVTNEPDDVSRYEHPCTCVVTTTDANHFILESKYIYVVEWKQRMIQRFVEAEFHHRIKEFFFAGYSRGMRQDRITDAFIDAYDLKGNTITVDMIKKYDYRHRKKVNKEIATEIQMTIQFGQ